MVCVALLSIICLYIGWIINIKDDVSTLQHGHVAISRVLLCESQISAVALNLRGQNPLHMLAVHQPSTASAIAKIFLEAMPEYPLDALDVHGNTGNSANTDLGTSFVSSAR